jgi:nucleoside-triphosphatase THEP1
LFDSQTDVAAVVYGARDDPDRLLGEFARSLQEASYRAAGLIQFRGRSGSVEGDVLAIALPTRAAVFLRHNRGRASGACHLDPAQLGETKKSLSSAINDGVDLIIINRFGKLEIAGMGFVDEIHQAVSAEIPVLIAVPEEFFMAWTRFSEGMGVKLQCSRERLDAWWRTVSGSSHQYLSHPPRTFCEIAK